jgi:hypothetical protein
MGLPACLTGVLIRESRIHKKSLINFLSLISEKKSDGGINKRNLTTVKA